jgi:hypothetical protein
MVIQKSRPPRPAMTADGPIATVRIPAHERPELTEDAHHGSTS